MCNWGTEVETEWVKQECLGDLHYTIAVCLHSKDLFIFFNQLSGNYSLFKKFDYTIQSAFQPVMLNGLTGF